jgi:ferredoxin
VTPLYDYLRRFDADEWLRAVDMVSANIADVDREATRIWFAFYPLRLHVALEEAADRPALERKLGLMGRWGLSDTVDTSHRFFYGHPHWPAVKHAIRAAESWPQQLPAFITQVAEAASQSARVPREMVLGLTAAGLMTLRQAGPEAFAAMQPVPAPARTRTPRQVMEARAKDDWQGLLGFLRGVRKRWTVTFNELDPAARFTAIERQDLASAAQSDKREYRSKDPRCIPNEGPIPVECRAASCGTCWVGLLGGAEKLTPVEAHEAKRMSVFGYADLAEGSRPVIRLACQAKVQGAVSIVIPPWNGIIGRL